MKVKTYVHVVKDAQYVVLRPGDTVPDGVTVTNPAAIDGDSAREDEEAAEAAAKEAAAKKAPAKKAPASE